MGVYPKDDCTGEITYSGGYNSDFHGKNMALYVNDRRVTDGDLSRAAPSRIRPNL